jgi:hypothetical protein
MTPEIGRTARMKLIGISVESLMGEESVNW